MGAKFNPIITVVVAPSIKKTFEFISKKRTGDIGLQPIREKLISVRGGGGWLAGWPAGRLAGWLGPGCGPGFGPSFRLGFGPGIVGSLVRGMERGIVGSFVGSLVRGMVRGIVGSLVRGMVRRKRRLRVSKGHSVSLGKNPKGKPCLGKKHWFYNFLKIWATLHL